MGALLKINNSEIYHFEVKNQKKRILSLAGYFLLYPKDSEDAEDVSLRKIKL